MDSVLFAGLKAGKTFDQTEIDEETEKFSRRVEIMTLKDEVLLKELEEKEKEEGSEY